MKGPQIRKARNPVPHPGEGVAAVEQAKVPRPSFKANAGMAVGIEDHGRGGKHGASEAGVGGLDVEPGKGPSAGGAHQKVAHISSSTDPGAVSGF